MPRQFVYPVLNVVVSVQELTAERHIMEQKVDELEKEAGLMQRGMHSLRASSQVTQKQLSTQRNSMVQIVAEREGELTAAKAEVQELTTFKEAVVEKDLMCGANFDSLYDQKLSCGHRLCNTCIKSLVQRHSVHRFSLRCPLCREEQSITQEVLISWLGEEHVGSILEQHLIYSPA